MAGALATFVLVLAGALIVGQSLAALAAGATRERPAEISGKGKAAFGLTYTEDAKAKIKIERRTGCSGKGCKKFAKVGTRRAKAFTVEDKIALKLKLEPGSYRATATATDPAGNRSKRKRLSFSVR